LVDQTMLRREFMTVLGGAAAWPLAARAQLDDMRRIGVLIGPAESDAEAQSEIAAFRRSLQNLGLTGGKVRIAYRWAADRMGMAPARGRYLRHVRCIALSSEGAAELRARAAP
jgi:hypothetical protein